MQFVDYYNYYYEYSTPVYTSPVISIASLALSVLLIVAMWVLFKKAGKPGWASIVPFYNIYVLYEITWGSGWRFLMLLIPFYNIILGIQTQVKLAKAFGKGGGFAVGLIFLPYVFNPILAFSDAAYLGVPGKNGTYQQSQRQGYAPDADSYQRQDPYQQSPYQQTNTYQQPQQPQDDGFQVTHCPNCGARVTGGKFCENCGKPL